VLRWFRDVLGQVEVAAARLLHVNPYELLTREAGRAPPGSSGLLFLPFMAGERFPFRDPYSRGVLLGLRYDHEKCHLVRAFMEGVAMTLRAIVEALEDSGVRPRVLVGGGGGTRSRLWAGIIASATGKPVLRVRGGEYASNKGAAALALRALGVVEDVGDLEWVVEVEERVEPSPQLREVYDDLYAKFLKAYNLLAPLFREWAGGQLPKPSAEELSA